MERRVEEGEKAEQAPELDEPGEARREQAQRRDGQREDQKQQGVVAGGESDVRCGVGAEGVGDGPDRRAARTARGRRSR